MSRDTLTTVVVDVSQTLWLRALTERFVPVLLRPLCPAAVVTSTQTSSPCGVLPHQVSGSPARRDAHQDGFFVEEGSLTATGSTGPFGVVVFTVSPPFSSTLSAPFSYGIEVFADDAADI